MPVRPQIGSERAEAGRLPRPLLNAYALVRAPIQAIGEFHSRPMGPPARQVPSARQRSASSLRPHAASDWRKARLQTLQSRCGQHAEHTQIGVHDKRPFSGSSRSSRGSCRRLSPGASQGRMR